MCSLWDDVLLCEDLTCFFTRSVFPCVALGCGKGCSWPLTSLDAASIHSQLQMQILRKGTLVSVEQADSSFQVLSLLVLVVEKVRDSIFSGAQGSGAHGG